MVVFLPRATVDGRIFKPLNMHLPPTPNFNTEIWGVGCTKDTLCQGFEYFVHLL